MSLSVLPMFFSKSCILPGLTLRSFIHFKFVFVCGVSACMLSHFSRVQLFATLWTVAHQALLSGLLRARILEWVAMPTSRGSS